MGTSGDIARRLTSTPPRPMKMKNPGRYGEEEGKKRESAMSDPCFKLFYGPTAFACPGPVDRRDGGISAAILRANAAYDSDLRLRAAGGTPFK